MSKRQPTGSAEVFRAMMIHENNILEKAACEAEKFANIHAAFPDYEDCGRVERNIAERIRAMKWKVKP